MFSYVVRCRFSDVRVATDWLTWLQDEHIADVIQAGAVSATIVCLDSEPGTYEIHYRFPGRTAFQLYEQNHAGRLRNEGLQRFPLSWGLEYERTAGEIVYQTS